MLVWMQTDGPIQSTFTTLHLGQARTQLSYLEKNNKTSCTVVVVIIIITIIIIVAIIINVVVIIITRCSAASTVCISVYTTVGMGHLSEPCSWGTLTITHSSQVTGSSPHLETEVKSRLLYHTDVHQGFTIIINAFVSPLTTSTAKSISETKI